MNDCCEGVAGYTLRCDALGKPVKRIITLGMEVTDHHGRTPRL
jgi:hypothetical protein